MPGGSLSQVLLYREKAFSKISSVMMVTSTSNKMLSTIQRNVGTITSFIEQTWLPGMRL